MDYELGYCAYCNDHYLADDGHSCDKARSGSKKVTKLHNPTTCRTCTMAYAAQDAHEVMAQYTIPGKVRVEIGWIGEGESGDFAADDPKDTPLLRFDTYDLTKHADPADCADRFDCCRSGQDASYCTRLPATLPVPVLESICRSIAEAIVDEERWKRRLEELSWLEEKDAKRIHAKYTKV
jgi:hypothetical protein